MSRALERVLENLDRPKQEGDRYFAFCPVHPDGQKHGRRSLSIKAGDDGRVLLHCFAGCPNREIVSAVGMQMYELYDDLVEDEGPRKREWPIRDSKGRVVAVHHRMDLPDGKKPVWWTRNGTKGLGGSNSNADDPSSIGAKLPSSQAHLYAVALDVVVVPRVLGRGIAHPLPA